MEGNTGRTGLTEVEKDMFFCLLKNIISFVTIVRREDTPKQLYPNTPKILVLIEVN